MNIFSHLLQCLIPFMFLCKGSHHGEKVANLWTLFGRGVGGLTNYIYFGMIFVIYMEILERIYFVLKNMKFVSMASFLLEEDDIIEIWCHHPPSIFPLLGQKKQECRRR